MSGDEEIKEKLQRAVHLIEAAQNSEGGWRYQPAPYDADISVTICQIMALRSAQDAGIRVEPSVINRALNYVISCQNADGGFSYMAHQGGEGSGYARTAAGCASLYYAGRFEGNNITNGLAFLRKFIGGNNISGDMENNFFYGNYYAVQAMFLAGGDDWKRFYPYIRDTLIAREGDSDHWSGDFTEEYATAMALIILQMPNRYLPVYNGKGPGS